MSEKLYRRIVAHYESCLERHGDTHRGVDWPRLDDAEKRYAVMLDLVRSEQPVTLLDFGCGAGHFYEYLQRRHIGHVRYTGLDLSPRFVDLCRTKFPDVRFYCLDILDEAAQLPRFDYIVLNGVFTEKRELSYEQMLEYVFAVLRAVFSRANAGIAFNVMSKHVDWERDDLFHLPMDVLAAFLTREVSRHFVFRNDYGLYEYTAYVYREPTAWPA
jgi:SAM-dependent methyltransferase